MEDCKNGGAGAGHEDSLRVAAVGEPVLELSKVAVFCEDGLFEIVDQGERFVGLRLVVDTGDGVCIEAFPVGVWSGDGELWFKKDDFVRWWGFRWHDDFAASGAAGCAFI